jgi:hypothetical protein
MRQRRRAARCVARRPLLGLCLRISIQCNFCKPGSGEKNSFGAPVRIFFEDIAAIRGSR